MKWILALLLSITVCHAEEASPPPADMFTVNDSVYGAAYSSTAGLTARELTIDPYVKTLVLLTAGQSQWQDINPTLYSPVNSTVIDNFSIYDGGTYNIAGPLLGTQYTGVPPQGPGNIAVRIADAFVTNGVFNRVIIVPVAIGGTTIANWSTQVLYNRVCVSLLRLASRGVSQTSTGVTFALIFGQGESDNVLATSQVSYTASWNSMFNSMQACNLTGLRTFVPVETWVAGAVWAPVQAAQAALVNGTTIFSGGNLDTLNAANRQSDNTHFNDVGAAAAATIVYNAMRASGAPF